MVLVSTVAASGFYPEGQKNMEKTGKISECGQLG